jgi:hypothetical protein
MKKPSASKQSDKRTKRTPEEKATRKSGQAAERSTSEMNAARAKKKDGQKKSLKSAAKQLQKELNNRMNEVVTRIRKETKAKLKEVVKEATARLDGDTSNMFEQALQTIVRHYDSVTSLGGNEQSSRGTAASSRKKSQTLNKDGSPRKARAQRASDGDAADDAEKTDTTSTAPSRRGRKPGTATASSSRRKPAAASTPASGARRGPKPGTAATGARRGRKPAGAAATEEADVTNSATSPGTGEVSE